MWFVGVKFTKITGATTNDEALYSHRWSSFGHLVENYEMRKSPLGLLLQSLGN